MKATRMTRRQTGIFCLLLSSPWLAAVASADAVDLSCSQPQLGYSLLLSIDMSASTATAWLSTTSRTGVAANSATITSDQVSWSAGPSGDETSYVLDRQTGSLNLTYARGGGSNWSCKKSTPVL